MPEPQEPKGIRIVNAPEIEAQGMVLIGFPDEDDNQHYIGIPAEWARIFGRRLIDKAALVTAARQEH